MLQIMQYNSTIFKILLVYNSIMVPETFSQKFLNINEAFIIVSSLQPSYANFSREDQSHEIKTNSPMSATY